MTIVADFGWSPAHLLEFSDQKHLREVKTSVAARATQLEELMSDADNTWMEACYE